MSITSFLAFDQPPQGTWPGTTVSVAAAAGFAARMADGFATWGLQNRIENAMRQQRRRVAAAPPGISLAPLPDKMLRYLAAAMSGGYSIIALTRSSPTTADAAP